LRFRSVISANHLGVGPGYGRFETSRLVVVVDLLLCLLGKESLELGAKLVAARQIPVVC
jgi:hypothetical protein